MVIFYLDDTGDDKHAGFAALGIPAKVWRSSYQALVAHRRHLARVYSIPFACELHATEFIGGRGSAGQAVRHSGTRIEIFHGILDLANSINGATLLCAFDRRQHEATLYKRLMTRINKCVAARNAQAIVISDEGKNGKFRALARQLGKFNPIPSRYGAWPEGTPTKNMPNDSIVEDVIFRQSKECRFIQLVDFCAYALLRLELPLSSRPGLEAASRRLTRIWNTKAFAKDPRGLGIIRG